ncbi:conserved protein of unknown function [Bradyrhizobium sp. ORS 285]|uniref:outer membrane protein n=1 Tax=Bradyrhizobium sp. ORS 285 TaxID=115808 RepID=UPI0002408FFF|nr:outer membrane beta-barrel protein [Bradyrhizobium sp. ORS 285]CCD89795.1 conserved hypothetical protein [Bradyrhizobium sp. ORS 285]SMX56553.1 conserved protein of unknown function [Bradyrhizobium sp. ORS 285]
MNAGTVSRPDGCHKSTAGTIGGQLGYRWHISQMAYGIEAEGNWADFRGSNVSASMPNDSIGTNTDSYGLLTGHIVYAYNTVLLYAKEGGAAVTHNTYYVDTASAGTENANDFDVRWRSALGAGAEFRLNPQWSAGIEYNHLFEEQQC